MEFLNFCSLDSLNDTSGPPVVSGMCFHWGRGMVFGCELPSVSEDPGGRSKWIPQMLDLPIRKEKT